ncbi:hypothetical protein PHMEG_00031197 [Phytophthora megakarya]|uniref:Uncharacterized protein n=1 Tax=Phytophthora megakarya TaxID=4795 RepID=A0A225V0Z8_9STRA|nr:hypothetical protein PHMEG_00031197 [Phytophthora megakarya]
MQSHMSYDEALAAARADAKIHSHLDARHLVSMLVRIIYWKSLAKIPWVKYVPCWCYKEAESTLVKALTSGEVPTRWPNLRKDIPDDTVENMAALYDSVTSRASAFTMIVHGLSIRTYSLSETPGRREAVVTMQPKIQLASAAALI